MFESNLIYEQIANIYLSTESNKSKLVSLNDEFLSTVSQIGDGGSDLGGDLGEEDKVIFKEVSRRLGELHGYISEVNKVIYDAPELHKALENKQKEFMHEAMR